MGEGAPMEEHEENGLVERARRGDASAFERLVKTHLSRVWATAYRIVRDRADAEDLAQEVFMAAHRALGEFRGESRFGTWLHRITVTRSLNHLDRAEEKVRRASSPIEAEARDEDRPAAREPRDRGPSPLQSLADRETLGRLRDCFQKLPPAWRAVVALRDGESLSSHLKR